MATSSSVVQVACGPIVIANVSPFSSNAQGCDDEIAVDRS